MRSYILKENHIGLAVLARYFGTDTDTHRSCYFYTRIIYAEMNEDYVLHRVWTRESKGIRQWLINKCTLYIPNDDTQNYPLYRLQLVVIRLIH